jgi:hypothetical protein
MSILTTLGIQGLLNLETLQSGVLYNLGSCLLDFGRYKISYILGRHRYGEASSLIPY